MATVTREREALIARLVALANRYDMTATERYEADAEAFYRETGYMSPGKDVPMAMGGQDERERRDAYDVWSAKRNQAQQAALIEAAAALASPAPQPAESDGSVMVRIDRVYVDAMRGDGLTGPFACVRLVEHEGEPRLELTTAPVPTPDTADWWREVAQGLGVEIAKMKALVSAPACVATTPQGDVCGLCGRPSADHRGPENAAAPAPAVGEAAPPFPDQCEVGESMASDYPTAHQAWTAIRNMPPEQWGNVVEFVAYGLFGPRPAKGGR